MKYLYLLRHAKSTRDYPELTDFERPLSRRGRLDAPIIGRFLLRNGIKPDIILSSPANRALTTARFVAEAIQYPLSCISVHEDIYEAWTEQLIDVLKRLKESHQTVLLVGHNPSLQLLAGYLCNFQEENLPTGGLLGITLNIEHWNDVQADCGKLLFFEYPKKLA